jgi:hypothetical protein
MGTIYFGPYADAISAYDHEGYAARIRPDRTETATWSCETREFIGYRAHCDCGWRGLATYPPTDDGEQLALEEWDEHHLQPMIDAEASKHTVPAATLLAFTRELRSSLAHTVDDEGDRVLTQRSAGVLDAVERLEQLLDHLIQGAGLDADGQLR